jgi:hypothetical protein
MAADAVHRGFVKTRDMGPGKVAGVSSMPLFTSSCRMTKPEYVRLREREQWT